MEPINPYFHLDADVARGLVRIVRTSVAMPADTAEVKRIYAELAPPLARFAGYKALLDLRAVPAGRNDDAFEAAALDAQKLMARAFSRTAVLVRSAAGKLQVRRMTSNHPGVFQDEAEAIRYLTQG